MASAVSTKGTSFSLTRRGDSVLVASATREDPRSSRRLNEVLEFLNRIPQGRGALAQLERSHATLQIIDPSGHEKLEAAKASGGALTFSMSGMSADWLAAKVVGECARLREQELGAEPQAADVAGAVATVEAYKALRSLPDNPYDPNMFAPRFFAEYDKTYYDHLGRKPNDVSGAKNAARATVTELVRSSSSKELAAPDKGINSYYGSGWQAAEQVLGDSKVSPIEGAWDKLLQRGAGSDEVKVLYALAAALEPVDPAQLASWAQTDVPTVINTVKVWEPWLHKGSDGKVAASGELQLFLSDPTREREAAFSVPNAHSAIASTALAKIGALDWLR